MRNSSRRSRKEALGFLVFVGLIFSLVWLTHSRASNSIPSEALRVQNRKQPSRQCSSCPPPSSRRIYAPAIDLDEAQSCEIVLNSRSANPIDITPTFYTAGGAAIIGDPIHLLPAEIRFVPVEQLMPPSIRRVHRWGGIALSYTGNVLEVWAQITFHGIGGGSIDETFNVLEEPGSDTREAVWWMPRKSTAVLALGNSSGNAARANIEFSRGESEEVDIPAGKTRFVRRHATGNQARIESVKIVTQGDAGAIRLAGFIAGDDESFASSIRFYDTKKTAQPNLYALNLRLSQTTPRIVLKNTSDATVTAKPIFLTSNGNEDNPVELPSRALAPHEVVDLELSGLRAASASRSDLDSVGVRIENSGAPGSLIGAAYSTDHTTGLTYDVPLRDTGPSRNRTGSYPWRIDGDYSTIVSVSNAGNQPAAFQVEIRYADGPYSIRPRQLKPGETAYFDLRKLRDEQTPDRTGKTLPLTLDRGQFHWSVVATPGGGQIVGRAEVRGRSAHVVSSYSCPTCCPDHGPYGGFYPHAFGVTVSSFEPTESFAEMLDCYGNVYYQNILWYTLTTNNSAVATADSETYELYGEGSGSTYVVGHFWQIEWEFYESENGGACREWDYFPSDSASVTVHTPTSLSRLDYRAFDPGAPDGYGPLKICADTNNEVRDVKNQVKMSNQCGAYRNLVYELLDENGDPITEAYSITENFSNYSSSPSSSAPSSDTKNISANGIINDTMYIGKTLPACLGSDDYESFNQTFVVTMNGQTYNLTTVIQVTRGRTSGAYYVDVVTATP
jgi:hypothetical protein